MYKKITSYFVLSLFVPLVALGDSSRARVYIPASTDAQVSGCATCEIKASGYSARYIFGNGFGLGLASSKATVTGVGITESYDSGPMIDFGYTFGSDWTFTVGYGIGSSPTYSGLQSSGWKVEGKSATNFFFGLGKSFGIYEILVKSSHVSTTYDLTYNGTPVASSTPAWGTTDIGIGFTF